MKDLFPGYFRRQDEQPDSEFYAHPRLVAHIDDAAIDVLGAFLDSLVSPGADVLDLMSAYLTHLTPEAQARCRRVVGLGMNDAEMAANSQLTEHLVHDLNADPTLPFPDDSFSLALCTVSVQYLLHPVEVFAEVRRVLKPGGAFVVSFSNRCFPTKATALWLSMDDTQHLNLVALYFRRSGDWQDMELVDLSPQPGISDPLFAVWARRS